MKGYKGFSPGMVCRGKQYAENTVYEEDKAEICQNGMHFCENPFDVWEFYPPTDESGNLNEFAEVEALDEAKTDDGVKFCTKKLKVGAKLKLSEFVQAGVDFVLEKTEGTPPATNTGDSSAATNTGYRSAATNTGYYSAATNTGYYSAATNTGDRSAATNTGDSSAATNTGYYSAATNTGDSSAASVEGEESIAIVTGKNSKAKGALRDWLVLTERDDDWKILGVKAVIVDGEKIKADTWYCLTGGEVKEAED